MRKSIIGFVALFASVPVMAQHLQSGYASMEGREIKALSSEQIADLRDGKAWALRFLLSSTASLGRFTRCR